MTSFSKICQLLHSVNHVLVVSHARPDGDALGSSLAVALWLQQEGHQVTVWNEDGLPQKFSYLPGSSLLSKPSGKIERFDAVFILDTATKERLGKTVLASLEAPLWIVLDHHITNECFGHFNLVESISPATGQILAEGMLQEKVAMTPEIATNLYVAISTDTGSFQYSQTSAKTFEIAAALVRFGVNVGAISQAMYASQPWRRFELLRHALAQVQLSSDGRVVSFVLSLADAIAFGIQPEDTEGIIDVARSVEGVMVAAFFEELPEGKVRLSLRSKTEAFDASLFCRFYGGGGHVQAAGARIAGNLTEVEKEVLSRIADSLPEPVFIA